MIDLETAQWRIVIPRPDDWMHKNKRRRTHWAMDARQTASWRRADVLGVRGRRVRRGRAVPRLLEQPVSTHPGTYYRLACDQHDERVCPF